MKILGIETSCDETAAAVVDGEGNILSQVIFSQIEEHAPYGGVVPEIASRAHIAHLDGIIEQTMKDAKLDYTDLDGVAATGGPGLIGGVLVGTMMAKGIAAAAHIPYLAINHLEGHALTARMTDNVSFPFLLLLVSGGHCQILSVTGVGEYERLGGTIDDAIGEAFDKVAKMLGLGYPGGPIVEKRAKEGNENVYPLPKPLCERTGCDFSLSGLKTAVLRTLQKEENVTEEVMNNLCASFQKTCGDIIENRMTNAIEAFKAKLPDATNIVVAGGVAANQYLGGRLRTLAEAHEMTLIAPPMKLCTDNAAMIAWAGVERIKRGESTPLSFSPRARWPLNELR
jgi:N6-L-threonylcarbamoyladenine synthase